MSVIDELLANNARYAAGFAGPRPAAPARGVAVVTCMDARLHVAAALGLAEGDAHVIRNAGGIVTEDTVRSLSISQRLVGTRAIMLIHHTGCGLLDLSDEEFRRDVERDTGVLPRWRTGGFTDTEQDVRDSIARLQTCPFLPHREEIRGFVFEVATGRLREVTG